MDFLRGCLFASLGSIPLWFALALFLVWLVEAMR